MTVLGRFEMVSSENYGEFLKAAGVGMIQRNLAEKAKPTVEITETGGKFTIKELTALKNTEIHFVPGQEFDETTPDGRQAKSTITMHGDDRLSHSRRIGDDETKIMREFHVTEMKETSTCRGVVASRVFKRL